MGVFVSIILSLIYGSDDMIIGYAWSGSLELKVQIKTIIGGTHTLPTLAMLS